MAGADAALVSMVVDVLGPQLYPRPVTPNTRDAFPTVGSMISKGQRALVTLSLSTEDARLWEGDTIWNSWANTDNVDKMVRSLT